VLIVAIKAKNIYGFSVVLSPHVEAAVPQAVGAVLQLIQ